MNLNDESVTIDKGCTVALLVPAAGVIDVGIDKVINSSEGSEESLAEHIQPLLDECKKEIGLLESLKLSSFLKNYTDVFSSPNGKLGVTHKAEHTIDTGDAIPIKQRAWRMPFARREVAEKEVERMLEQGVLEPSTSPWASPIVLVTKKDGSVRFCVDYRKINSCTRKDAYPLPRVSECLDTLAGAKWFSTLDLTSGYWQVPITEQDKHKTAFTVGGGLYQFKVLPFGLCNAPATFERLMEMVLNGLQWKQCLVYLDDIILFGSSFDTALENLSTVFDRLRTAGLTLKPKKCFLFRKSVKFLGHVVSENGVSCDPDKIKAVRNCRAPVNKTEVRQFLGLGSYYRRFIADFATIAAPLHALTRKNAQFIWDENCQLSFATLKSLLTSAPVLSYPDPNEGEFILDTDASGYAISGLLSQMQQGQEKVIAYGSKSLSSTERRYCTTNRELLAVVFC